MVIRKNDLINRHYVDNAEDIRYMTRDSVNIDPIKELPQEIIKLYIIKYKNGSTIEFFDKDEYKEALLKEKNVIDNYELKYYDEFAGLKDVLSVKRNGFTTYLTYYKLNEYLVYIPEESFHKGMFIWRKATGPAVLNEYYEIIMSHGININPNSIMKFKDEENIKKVYVNK